MVALAGRRAQRFKARRIGVGQVHAIRYQHMEMHVQVQRTAKALNQGDRAALPRGPCEIGLVDQKSTDGAVYDPQRLAHCGRIADEQEA